MQKNWAVNGETVKYNADGTESTDGQHRMKGFVEYSTAETFTTLVVWSDEILGVDKGRSRTLSQWLHNARVSNPDTVAATLRLLHGYRNKGTFPAGGVKITDSEGLKLYNEILDDQQNAEAFNFGQKIASKMRYVKSGSPNVYASVGYLVGVDSVNRDLFDSFTDRIISRPVNISGKTTMDKINKTLQGLLDNASKASRGVISFDVIGTLLIEGWNAFAKNSTVTVTGLEEEIFKARTKLPTIHHV